MEITILSQPSNSHTITQLTDHLWTGGDLPAQPGTASFTLDAWLTAGIDTIIDTRAEWTDEDLVTSLAPQVSYLHAGVYDEGQTMPDSWFDATTSFALDRINAGSTVLAHCHMGINRGPSTAYAILLTLGWDPVDAVDHIHAMRPIAAVFYAEDAVRWASRRQELLPSETNHQISRLADWRAAHPMEAGRTMRAPRIEPLPQQQH